MNEIQEVKAQISELDRKAVELQAKRFTATMRLSVLLAQAAKANPPVESGKQLSKFYDAEFGGNGFEENGI